jgi:DNA-binding MarR family transcriptional regulator
VARREPDLRQVFDDLVRFETLLWNAIEERLLRECGAGLGTVNVMMVVASTPACRVLDISAALGITVGGTSQAVDRIERAGYCARRPNPADRRSSVVALTPAGEQLLSRAEPILDDALESAFHSHLSSAELGQLGSALAVLRAAAAPRRP